MKDKESRAFSMHISMKMVIILCIPVTGHGLTMSAFEAALYSKEVGATLTIPIHMDNPVFPPDFKVIEEMFNKYEVEYEILENYETIEVE